MNYALSLLLFSFFSSGHANIMKQDFNDSTISSAITYELNGGRFGDNLLSYSRAKWLSYTYDIPLMLFPFPYSDQLILSERELPLCIEKFNNIVRLPSSKNYTLNKNNNTLYINHWHTKVSINWNDPIFVTQLKSLIAPLYEIKKIVIPQGYLTVAVHVRKGNMAAVDTLQEQERCPLRFVPDEFYIAQIDRIAKMYPDQKLYVYIFTDHSNPKLLAEKFSNALNNHNITFDYQQEKNGHNINVLEDFFSMMQFDCLIRPGSHFSRFVERLGNAQLVIYPDSYTKSGNQPAV